MANGHNSSYGSSNHRLPRICNSLGAANSRAPEPPIAGGSLCLSGSTASVLDEFIKKRGVVADMSEVK